MEDKREIKIKFKALRRKSTNEWWCEPTYITEPGFPVEEPILHSAEAIFENIIMVFYNMPADDLEFVDVELTICNG